MDFQRLKTIISKIKETLNGINGWLNITKGKISELFQNETQREAKILREGGTETEEHINEPQDNLKYVSNGSP